MVPKTIVVPLDGSALAERAIPVAAPLARRLDADLVLMTTRWEGDERSPASYLDAVAALAVDVPVDVQFVPDLDPVGAIEGVVDERADALVCMTTHGRGRLRWAVAGSIAEDVIRRSTRPLLLVGPHGAPTSWEPPGQIVVCLDGSQACYTTVAPACDWARVLGLEITFAYVGHPLDVEDAVHPEQVFEPAESMARAAGVVFHTRYVRSTFVAGSLLDVADEPPATMIVMSTHARTGFARVALGSVTMGVLTVSSHPVLVTPPDQGARAAERED